MQHTHSDYICHVVRSLNSGIIDESARRRFRHEADAYTALLMLDLTPALPFLGPCYAQRKGGRPPRNALALFRCFVAMALFRVASFHQWARRLRCEPELRVFCGFDVDDTGPGASTLYDFVRRITDGPWVSTVPKRQREASQWLGARNKFRRNLRKEKLHRNADNQAKLAQKSEGRVTALVDDAIRNWSRAVPTDFTERLNSILLHCVVSASAAQGLLGPLSKLNITMDGSALPTQARRRGKCLCDCRVTKEKDTQEQPALGCEHDRLYADPQATIGWDSHREEYYFGHRMHVLLTHYDGVDLPLYISVNGAHHPDVVAGVTDLERCSKMLRKVNDRLRPATVTSDVGYDASGFYRMIEHLGAAAIIPLHPNTKNVDPVSLLPRSENGVPLCKGNLEMRYHGYHRIHQTHVYNCPIKRPGKQDKKTLFRVHINECPLGVLCEPDTKMGPLLHLKTEGDPRFNPRIPRASQLFKDIYKTRTGTERFNSQTKVFGKLGTRPYRRRWLFEWMLLAHGIAIHAKQWLNSRNDLPKSLDDVVEFCERLNPPPDTPPPPTT